jgi:hypothetical protein
MDRGAEMEFEGTGWIRTVAGSCENRNEYPVAVIGGQFIDLVSDYQFMKNKSAAKLTLESSPAILESHSHLASLEYSAFL